MGIISWARSRFNGKTERCQVVPEEKHHTDEQQHWRSQQDQAAGFLSIGTLGNVIEEPAEEDHPTLTHDLPEFTIEEAEKLQNALAKFLSRAKSMSGARGADGLPLDRFLDCASSLDVGRRVLEDHDEGGGNLSPHLLVNTGESRASGIKNRSFKFLLRKMFVCHGGFTSSQSLKINVRPSSTSAVKSYCSEHRPNGKLRRRNGSRPEVDDEEEDCCRWDRTDSEFIVLELWRNKPFDSQRGSR